ncbi:MAG: MFS transporter [Candidatus Thermoplasmatota archaeon]|nr:MFS transporter [Candidatus Thermoplasmatota archaeon]MCL5730942.1 MFS transporter [Candidatus Thermoplasmatota archaeon]
MYYSYRLTGLDRRVWLLGITRFVRSFGRSSTFILLPLVFVIDYGVGFFETGLLIGSGTLIMAFVQYYAGIWTDRIGRRKILVFTQIPNIFFYFLMFLIIYYHDFLIILVAAWLLTIVVNAIQYPAVQATVADVTSVSDRLSGYTALRLMANLGFAFGPLIGAFLASYGLQYIFLLASLSNVIEVLILYKFMRETHIPTGKTVTRKSLNVSYKADRFFLSFMIVGILYAILSNQRSSALTIYTVVLQNMPIIYIGYIWAFNGILVVIMQVPFLKLMTSYLTPMAWRAIGVAFGGISFLVLLGPGSLGILLLFMFISTIGEDFMAPTTQSIITSIAPLEFRGSYIGVYSLYTSLGTFAGSVLGLSLLSYLAGIPQQFWIIVAFSTVAVAALYLIMDVPFKRRFRSQQTLE